MSDEEGTTVFDFNVGMSSAVAAGVDETYTHGPGAGAGVVSSPEEPSPTKIGTYEVLNTIARGGMGVVYRVKDPKLGREVALKMMRSGSWFTSEEQDRFLREAHLMAELAHPGIVPVHDMGIVDGVPYYTMDLVSGRFLDKYIRDEKLSLQAIVRLFVEICGIVHYAHMKGVVHRDLKPKNILVTPVGRPMIFDFGIARLTRVNLKKEMTTISGVIMGTPSYMAPEQALGRVKEIDTRSDVYALGVILYELMTGRKPFSSDETLTLLRAIVEDDPPRPSRYAVKLPVDLECIILKAIAKEKERRYATVDALAVDLKRFLGGRPVEAHADTAWYRMQKWIRRHEELALTAGAALLLLLFVAGWSFWHLYQAKQVAEGERVRADGEKNKAVAALDQLKNEQEAREKKAMAEALLTSAQRLSNLDDKLGILEQALALDPTHIQAHLRRGTLLHQSGRLGEALEAFEVVVRLDPNIPQAFFGIGMVKKSQERYPEALAAFDKAIDLDEDWIAVHITRAEMLQRLGRLDEALVSFDRVVVLNPKFSQAHYRRGQILQLQFRYQEAFNAFEAALAVDPTLAEAHQNKGRILLYWNRLEEALACTEQALACNSHLQQAHVNRLLILDCMRRWSDLETFAERSIALFPDMAEFYFFRGCAIQDRFGRRGFEEAVECYKTALSLKWSDKTLMTRCQENLARVRRILEQMEK